MQAAGGVDEEDQDGDEDENKKGKRRRKRMSKRTRARSRTRRTRHPRTTAGRSSSPWQENQHAALGGIEGATGIQNEQYTGVQ